MRIIKTGINGDDDLEGIAFTDNDGDGAQNAP